jgi:hypothetical protein
MDLGRGDASNKLVSELNSKEPVQREARKRATRTLRLRLVEPALLRCVYVAENTHSVTFGIASGTDPGAT